MHLFRLIIPKKLMVHLQGKFSVVPLGKSSGGSGTKALEAQLLKKGMELLRDYPLKAS